MIDSRNQIDLGREQTFIDLITGSRSNTGVVEKLHSLKPRSALDIGCGLPLALFALHSGFGVTDYLGIDAASQNNILRPLRNYYPPDVVVNFTAAIRHVSHADELTVRKFVERPGAFCLSYPFESPVAQMRSASRFDVVILSNIVHFWDVTTASSMLAAASDRLAPNGILYIRLKTNPKNLPPACDAIEVRDLCRAFASNTGLAEYRGQCTEEGFGYTWTNL